MSQRKDKVLFSLGIFYLLCWMIDFVHNAVVPHDYSWIFWYSSAGFFITGVALISQNIKLLYSLFCALFVVETLWVLDAAYALFSHHTLMGFTDKLFYPSFRITDFYFSLYHTLIPTGLLFAIQRTKQTYQYGWIGAIIFATTLGLLSYFLTGPQSQVNCIHSLNKCRSIFAFLYNVDTPYRILIAIVGLTFFVFIPTNRIVLYFKEKHLTQAA